MKKYFELCDKLEFDNHEWKSYFFSEVSALAYHDGTRVKREILRLGFKNYKFIDNDGAQCHIFHNSEHIVISFRGTEPTQFSDVKADLLAFKRKSKTEGKVHMGFKIELRKLWNDISGILNRRTKQQIWITGHSLGGAMATLCASRLEERNPILYTYGSPRVGGREWRDGCDVEHHRFRNNNDVVPVIPLWLMGYRHHGKLCYINYYGNIRKLTLWQKLKDSMRGRWKALKKFQLFDGIYDHNITLYSDKLKDLYAYTGKILIK
tara:strand:- start:3169 stop:3960 length:792 start_codon:yes stop_codon:yes gene_type:complete